MFAMMMVPCKEDAVGSVLPLYFSNIKTKRTQMRYEESQKDIIHSKKNNICLFSSIMENSATQYKNIVTKC